MYYWFDREIRGIQQREACGINVGLCIVGCLIFMLAYSLVVLAAAFSFFNVDIPRAGTYILIRNMNPTLFYIAVVLAEELMFRLPLAALVQRGWSMNTVFSSAIVLSMIFGIYHGNIDHFFLQGVAGIAYSILFLKCGGSQGHYGKALVVTTSTHFLYNAIQPFIFLG